MPLIIRFFNLSSRAPSVLTLLICMCFASLSDTCSGQEEMDQASSPSVAAEHRFETEDFTVAIGIENTIRLGKWVPVTVTPKRSQEITQIELETRDGADVPVLYEAKYESPVAGSPAQALVRFGRKSNSFKLNVLTKDGAVAELVVPLADTQTLLSVQPLILTIERGRQITDAINGDPAAQPANENRWLAKQVLDLSGLPESWLAYDAVDTIFLATNDTQLLSELSEKQLVAIEGWVRHGGKLILSATPENSADWLAPEKPLARFAPGEINDTQQFQNSSRLENFAQSRKQLLKAKDQPIDTVIIPPSMDKVWVVDENRSSLIVQHPLGLGSVVFVAFDLKQPELSIGRATPNSFVF